MAAKVGAFAVGATCEHVVPKLWLREPGSRTGRRERKAGQGCTFRRSLCVHGKVTVMAVAPGKMAKGPVMDSSCRVADVLEGNAVRS
jgi:hypothetical protein